MFDPTEFTVKDARKKLDGLSLENLAAVLKLESDNKNRSSSLKKLSGLLRPRRKAQATMMSLWLRPWPPRSLSTKRLR